MTASGEAPRKLTKAQERIVARVHTTVLDALYAERHELVRALRAEGWTYAAIAALLGLSKQRVQQLTSER